MPNIAHCARIKCPYFLRFTDNGRMIICEGLIPGSEIANAFRRAEAREGWVGTVCETHDYSDRCLLAKALGGKYEQ